MLFSSAFFPMKCPCFPLICNSLVWFLLLISPFKPSVINSLKLNLHTYAIYTINYHTDKIWKIKWKSLDTENIICSLLEYWGLIWISFPVKSCGGRHYHRHPSGSMIPQNQTYRQLSPLPSSPALRKGHSWVSPPRGEKKSLLHPHGDGKVKVKVAQSCLTLCNPMDYTVHGILQARILEWVAFPFSRGSSQPRDRNQVSRIAGRFFTSWATGRNPMVKGKMGHCSWQIGHSICLESK